MEFTAFHIRLGIPKNYFEKLVNSQITIPDVKAFIKHLKSSAFII